MNIIRSMTAKEVNTAVLKVFEHHHLKSFQYQSIDGALHFEVEKDGNMVFEKEEKERFILRNYYM